MSKSEISKNFKLLRETFSSKDHLFQLPVLNLHTEYVGGDEILEEEKQPYRVMVRFEDKICNVEEAAKAYFERQGFIVLDGADVNTFLRFFLLQIPSEFDDAMDFQIQQRRLINRFLAGEIGLKKIISNAVSSATIFYLPPKKQNRKLRSERWKIEKALRIFSFSLSPEKYSEVQRHEKERFLDLLANDFLPRCLRKTDIRKLTRAYTNMLKGNPPDLFFYSPKKRLWFFVEVKSLDDKLRLGQWSWIMQMQKYLSDHFLLLRVLPSERQLRRGDF